MLLYTYMTYVFMAYTQTHTDIQTHICKTLIQIHTDSHTDYIDRHTDTNLHADTHTNTYKLTQTHKNTR